MKPKIILGLRLLCSIILLQTLFFKFTGASVSVHIFDTLGVEPWGRIGAGISELIVSILILYPKTTRLGALGAVMIMLGAVASHLLFLGIDVMGDGGELFGLALVTLFGALGILYLTKDEQTA